MDVQDAPATDRIVHSVVVPVYNAAAMLPELHRRLSYVMAGFGVPYEIILVEDAGPDDSWAVAARLAGDDSCVRAVQLMRNTGQGSATVCGLARARGEVVVTLDDDLQHPPEEIPKLLDALAADPQVDVVIGAPRVKQHGPLRRGGSWLVDRMNTVMLGKPPGLRFTGFRVMTRAVAENLAAQRFHRPALGPMLLSVTDRISNVEVEHAPRAQGRSNYTPLRLLQQTMSNAIGYSMLPLRLLAGLGLVGIVASVALAVYFLVRYLTGGIGVPGFTTQALLMTALFGFNFFAFGVLGEYVLRILQLSGARQAYTVRDEVGGPG